MTEPHPHPNPHPHPDRELVVLAYSGGLDTTVIVHRLTHEQGRQVIALLADVGQGEDLAAAGRRAFAAGAVDAVVVDARKRFAGEFLSRAVAANALYEGRYPLVSALSRPLIAQLLIEEARHRGAGAVAHGCTGKGNDQVRFEVSCSALAPELEVLAPVRDWAMSRPEAIAYAEKHGIDLDWISADRPYSVDQNLWGRTVEAGALEDPWVAPPEDAFTWTAPPAATSEVREVYEVPGALATIAAHRELESITLDRDLLHEKARLEIRYAELVYDGLWFSPLREALDGFIAETQKALTGARVRQEAASGAR